MKRVYLLLIAGLIWSIFTQATNNTKTDLFTDNNVKKDLSAENSMETALFNKLYRLVDQNDVSAAQKLLQESNVNERNPANESLLHCSVKLAADPNKCAAGNTLVKLLLADPRTDVNLKDVFCMTPLVCACSLGNLEVVKMLFTCGKKIEMNTVSGFPYFPSRNPLTSAYRAYHEESNAKPDQKDMLFITRCKTIMEILFAQGATYENSGTLGKIIALMPDVCKKLHELSTNKALNAPPGLINWILSWTSMSPSPRAQIKQLSTREIRELSAAASKYYCSDADKVLLAELETRLTKEKH